LLSINLNMRLLITYLVLLFALTSCFEEDEMVLPHDPGDLTVGKVELTETYKYQVFFDLETNKSVKQNIITEWDLGFETSDSGWHVILNTSKMMLAGNTGLTDFETVKSIGGTDMNFDPSHGNLLVKWSEYITSARSSGAILLHYLPVTCSSYAPRASS